MSPTICTATPRTLLAAVAAAALALVACGDNLTLAPEREPATSEDPGDLACTPDLDGKIERDELAAAIGVPIRYLVSPAGATRPVDLVGTKDEEGFTIWNFTIDYADDRSQIVTPATPSGAWYEGLFPQEGAFVTPFDASGRLVSVGFLGDDGLYLLGVVSSEEAPEEGLTRLIYTEPVKILPLPVEVGAEQLSVGEIRDGVALGIPYAGRDVYEVAVDAIGIADLPQLSFDQVHRVTTKVTVEPIVGSSATRRQVSFYAECFAEVARATAGEDEEDTLFSEAAELRRLGF